MTSWRRWGSERLSKFVQPGDIVAPTGNHTQFFKDPNNINEPGMSMQGNDIGLVVAMRDVRWPSDDFNVRWLLVVCNDKLGWCASTNVQVLDID